MTQMLMCFTSLCSKGYGLLAVFIFLEKYLVATALPRTPLSQ